MGIVVAQAKNITIDGNVMGEIPHRTTMETGDKVLDVEGMYAICSTADDCQDIFVNNNIDGSKIEGTLPAVLLHIRCAFFLHSSEVNRTQVVHIYHPVHAVLLTR